LIEYKKDFLKTAKEKFFNNPSIKKSQINSRIYTQNGIDFSIEYLAIDNVNKKPINISNNCSSGEPKKPNDVFEPPFEDGILLEENFMNLGNHRLLFNKFPIKDNHMILVSKDFKSQYTHLDLFEISELILLQNYVNGIVFFNGGKKSGASQPRKHIQCIPLENISQEEFGIFKIFNDQKIDFFCKIDILRNINGIKNTSVKMIKNDNHLEDYFDILKIKKFEENGISHLFVDLTKIRNYFKNSEKEEFLIENFEEYTQIIYNIYLNVLNNLNLINEYNSENIFSDYSFLFTQDWLYVIPRKTDCVELKCGNLFLNSNSFTFSLLVKSQELEKEIQEIDIIKDIYTKL